MASVIKKCRVCGKKYESCRTVSHNAGVFRWQEVACSPECGAIYLERINESRGNTASLKKNKPKKETAQPTEITFEFVSEEALELETKGPNEAAEEDVYFV